MSEIQDNFITRINGEDTIFRILFFNAKYINGISLESLINLDIEENINSPFYKGILTIKNENNVFDTSKEYSIPTSEIFKYEFLEAGENYIHVEIQNEYTKKQYTFNIIEEYISIENNIKAKNFVLIDIHLWYMLNNKVNFSSAFLLDKDTSQLSNNDRMTDTSQTIKKLIKDHVSDLSINEEQWDKSKTKTFYSSNYNDSILDTLNAILENTLDDNNDNMLLLKRNNKFSLFSFSKLYKDFLKNNYTYNYGGTFSLTSDSNSSETQSSFNSIKVKDYSIYNEDNKNTTTELINYKVHNYDNVNKRFSIYNKNNNIKSTVEYLENNILNNKIIIDRKNNSNIEKNKYYNSFYSTSDDKTIIENEGKQEIIKNLINYTTGLNLQTTGMYSIDTGNFIVVNNDNAIFNKNLRKLYGGWFVTGFKHTFTIDSFNTEIACTKFYDLKKDE